jgi:hypothetical protein
MLDGDAAGAAEADLDTLKALADGLDRSGKPLVGTKASAPDEANDYFGFLGSFAQMDNPTSSSITREMLGWAPAHPGLIADLDEGNYFQR